MNTTYVHSRRHRSAISPQSMTSFRPPSLAHSRHERTKTKHSITHSAGRPFSPPSLLLIPPPRSHLSDSQSVRPSVRSSHHDHRPIDPTDLLANKQTNKQTNLLLSRLSSSVRQDTRRKAGPRQKEKSLPSFVFLSPLRSPVSQITHTAHRHLNEYYLATYEGSPPSQSTTSPRNGGRPSAAKPTSPDVSRRHGLGHHHHLRAWPWRGL